MLSPAAKARLSAPLILAIIVVAGGLYAIVWTVQWSQAGSTTSIQAATQAGATMVQPPSYASNVGDAFPTFKVAQAPTPDPANPMNQWLTTDWLAVVHGPSGDKWVYADAWLGCQYIDQAAMAYEPEGTGKQAEVWYILGVHQLSVIEVCNGQ